MRALTDSSLSPQEAETRLRALCARLREFRWGTPAEIGETASGFMGRALLEEYRNLLTLGRRAQRALCLEDRFYLLTAVLHRPDAFHPWIYQRCREVEASPDGHLDLWAREHYKSTIITFAGSIQEIIRDPNIRIGIFSHTAPDAKKFVSQIKSELETNEELKALFPEIFWAKPEAQSPLWSAEKGITVQRTSNAREATVEGHGVIESQPVGSHYTLMIFDDLVTWQAVNTPEQVKRTTNMYALADSLGARGEDGLKRKQVVGTRYSYADTYQELIDTKALRVRKYPATHNGKMDGRPVFLTEKAWALEKLKPSSVVAAQMLQDPAAGNEAIFKAGWLRWSDVRPGTLTVAIMCDPASSMKKGSDSTVIYVWGMDIAYNRYLLDGFHHKMGLAERWKCLRDLRQKWMNTPGVQLVKVGYERYGSTSDLEYFQERMEIEKISFEIVELAWPRQGPGSKYDRIQRLEPDFRTGKIILAAVPMDAEGNRVEETRNQATLRERGEGFRIYKPTRQVDPTAVQVVFPGQPNERQMGTAYGLNDKLLQEYLVYPFSQHDDALDTASRWNDMDMRPPVIVDQRTLEPEVFSDGA